jgi:hypothetical protein
LDIFVFKEYCLSIAEVISDLYNIKQYTTGKAIPMIGGKYNIIQKNKNVEKPQQNIDEGSSVFGILKV